jgi:hypothetical protein
VTAGIRTETTAGDGNRVSKTVGSTTASYVCDPDRSLPVVLAVGTLAYVWGLDLAYATDTSGNVQDIYHTHGLGSAQRTDMGAQRRRGLPASTFLDCGADCGARCREAVES